MPVAKGMVNTKAQRAPGTGTRETVMTIFGRKKEQSAAVVNFGGQWPLAFRVRMLTITGMNSNTLIPRRQS